ncbi:MAG TPA: hypothetical protein VHZ49_23250 [Methylomirabilota bacterium]|nr:hypothetical protein [Methylomirabilota bacterium]
MALSSTGNAVSSNNAVLVLECDAPPDPERVRASLERFLRLCPWPAARLRRPFPWGKLHWSASRRSAGTVPPVRRRVVPTAEDLRHAIDAELNAAIDPRREPPLRFLILEGAPGVGGVLVLTWFHPLMDPRGAQNLLHHLVQLDRAGGEGPWRNGPPSFVRSADERPFSERGRLARKSLEYMRTLPRAEPVSPAKGQPGRVRFRQLTFAECESRQTPSRLTREIWWRLAVVGKAMCRLREQRHVPDVPFVLPIAVDLRAKGDLGPTFGNMLAFHFARFKPSDTADVPRLASALRAQMAEAVRGGQIEANDVAMDFLQYRPLTMVRRALQWTGGGIFSFNCADVTDFPAALACCFGRRVTNAYHVPAVPPRPGIGVFFNRCAGRSNLVVAWIDGVVTDPDVTRIVETVREEMGWIEAS